MAAARGTAGTHEFLRTGLIRVPGALTNVKDVDFPDPLGRPDFKNAAHNSRQVSEPIRTSTQAPKHQTVRSSSSNTDASFSAENSARARTSNDGCCSNPDGMASVGYERKKFEPKGLVRAPNKICKRFGTKGVLQGINRTLH